MLDEIDVILGQQFLQERCLLVLHGLDDELVVAGDVENRARRSRIRQLAQFLVTNRVLKHRLVGDRKQTSIDRL